MDATERMREDGRERKKWGANEHLLLRGAHILVDKAERRDASRENWSCYDDDDVDDDDEGI